MGDHVNEPEPIETNLVKRTLRAQFVLLVGLTAIGAVMPDMRLMMTSGLTAIGWGVFAVHGRSVGWWE